MARTTAAKPTPASPPETEVAASVNEVQAEAPPALRLRPLPKMPDGGRTITPFAPACATFRSHLRRNGLKFTRERAAVLDAVLRRPSLFDAESIVDAIRDEGHRGSRATVYRTLASLQEAGLLRQVVFGNAQAFYEVIAGGRETHDYLVDIETGEVIPVQSPALRAARDALCAEHGYEPVRHQFHAFVRRKAPAAG